MQGIRTVARAHIMVRRHKVNTQTHGDSVISSRAYQRRKCTTVQSYPTQVAPRGRVGSLGEVLRSCSRSCSTLLLREAAWGCGPNPRSSTCEDDPRSSTWEEQASAAVDAPSTAPVCVDAELGSTTATPRPAADTAARAASASAAALVRDARFFRRCPPAPRPVSPSSS